MPCYHPLKGFRSAELTKNGKRKIVFSPVHGYTDLPVEVPCGQCIGCRLERSRQWAIRLTHEAQLHDRKCFVTLTYDDEHLPPGRNLQKRDFQLFMKRLRKNSGLKVRFYHCGEYGDTDGRPHYHAILFGVDFPDQKPYKRTKRDDMIFKSELLNQIWGKGHCFIGEVTPQSCAYTARYIMKKIGGEKAVDHYRYTDPETGEQFDRQPEYATMSLKPGIGGDWFDKFHKDVFPSDFVVLQGKRSGKAPKFYDNQLEKAAPAVLRKIKFNRIRSAAKHKTDQTPERLAVREAVKLSKISQLKRM